MFWKEQAKDNSFDVIIRSLYTSKHYSLRSHVKVLQDMVCKSLELVNLHSENFHMAEFGIKCINPGQTDRDFVIKITGTEKLPVFTAFELQKAESTIQLKEMFAARDYSESVSAVARLYLYSQTAMILELFDMEDGAIMYNIEFNVEACGFKVGETISKVSFTYSY